MNKIERFIDEYGFLSNFYECEVTIDGITYPHAEGAFQAHKTRSKKNKEYIATLPPHEAKKYGRTLSLSSTWDKRRDAVMKKVVLAKFTQNEDLKEKLLATGDAELIEGNWWGDQYWGVCGGYGENKLGKMLMEVREELRIDV